MDYRFCCFGEYNEKNDRCLLCKDKGICNFEKVYLELKNKKEAKNNEPKNFKR